MKDGHQTNYLPTKVCLDRLMRPASEVIGTDFFLREQTTAMLFSQSYSAFLNI